jgi:predicted membrane protein
MAKVLLWFLVSALIVETMDIVFHAYTAEETWDILSQLLFEKFAFKIVVVQWGLGMIVPLVLLLIPRPSKLRAFIAASLVLLGVFMMRWDVVIGGQSMSRSMAGFMNYDMPILPTSVEAFKEGLCAVLILLSAPYILLYVFNKFLPVYADNFDVTEEECRKIEEECVRQQRDKH